MSAIDFISVIVLTKDEEEGIGHTLNNLRDFADVVLIDSHSTDSTVEIAEKMGVRVVPFSWDGSYPKKKQWSLEHAGVANEWVLLLDADEYPSRELVEELRGMRELLASHRFAAFDIHLSYRFAGRILRHGHVVTKRSLLDAKSSEFPVMDDLDAPGIREVEGHYQPVAHGRVGRLRARIVHDDRDPVTSWFARHNRYSDWEAHLAQNQKLREEIASKRTLKGRIFDALPLKPVLFFLYAYFARMGFLDGRAGFDYATALTMYYWQIGVKSRELSAARTEGPRIVQLVNTLDRSDGGPAHHALELNIALNSIGIRARIIRRKTSGGVTTFDDASSEGRRPPFTPAAMVTVAGVRAILGADVCVIHGYYLLWVPVAVALGRLGRKKMLLMPHGALTKYEAQNSRALKRVFNLMFGGLINRSVHFVVATQSEADEASSGERSRRRITVVGAGVDVPNAQSKRGTEPWHIVTLSRIARKKRIDRAIAVLAELKKRGRDVHLTIAGDGDSEIRNELRQRIDEFGVEDFVTFAGPVHGEAKRTLLARAHVLLAPSEDENFGFGPVEALASGVPIVATDRIASIAHIGPPAGFAAPFAVHTAADAIESIMANHSESSAAATAFAQSGFSWSTVAGRWAALMDTRQ